MWHKQYEKVLPYIVRIDTQNGFGTGFLIGYSDIGKSFAIIATAAHVINDSKNWNQPIKLFHETSKTPIFLNLEDRAIFTYNNDSACILIKGDQLPFPNSTLPLFDASTSYKKSATQLVGQVFLQS